MRSPARRPLPRPGSRDRRCADSRTRCRRSPTPRCSSDAPRPRASRLALRAAESGAEHSRAPAEGRARVPRAPERSNRRRAGRWAGRGPGKDRRCRAGAGAHRCSSVQIGSSERLPLVATTGNSSSAARRWWSGVYGSMTPRYGLRGATPGATVGTASSRRRKSTMGEAGERSAVSSSSDRRHAARTASRSGIITANGFSSRCLRDRSRCTAASFRASTRRWKPPSPLTARISPRRSAREASSNASCRCSTTRPFASHSSSCGPHSGQAFGCA